LKKKRDFFAPITCLLFVQEEEKKLVSPYFILFFPFSFFYFITISFSFF